MPQLPIFKLEFSAQKNIRSESFCEPAHWWAVFAEGVAESFGRLQLQTISLGKAIGGLSCDISGAQQPLECDASFAPKSLECGVSFAPINRAPVSRLGRSFRGTPQSFSTVCIVPDGAEFSLSEIIAPRAT